MSSIQILFRLLLALVLGGAVGFEREKHGRNAGLRTHILVCISASLVMGLALYLSEQYQTDPTRIAAHVLSGMGFLGAGTILRFRASVKGLTTAASLWAVAGIGLAVGAGFYFAAITTTLLVLGALFWLTKVVDKLMMRRDWYRALHVDMEGKFEGLQNIRAILASHNSEIKDFNFTKLEAGDVRLVLELRLLSPEEEEPILKEVIALEGIKRAVWKEE